MFPRISVVATAISFLAAGSTALAGERTILFDAPGIPCGIGVSIQEHERFRNELLEWSDFSSVSENAMVHYMDAPFDRGFLESAFGRVKKFRFFYGWKIQGVRVEFVGKVEEASISIGTVDYIRARTTTPARMTLPKECFFFQMRYQRAPYTYVTRLLQGWYCAASGATLSDDVIYSVIGSLGIKGWKAP